MVGIVELAFQAPGSAVKQGFGSAADCKVTRTAYGSRVTGAFLGIIQRRADIHAEVVHAHFGAVGEIRELVAEGHYPFRVVWAVLQMIGCPFKSKKFLFLRL